MKNGGGPLGINALGLDTSMVVMMDMHSMLLIEWKSFMSCALGRTLLR